MHNRRGRGKDWVSDLGMQRPVQKLLVILLTTVLGLAALVLLGIAGAYQYLEPELPDAADLRKLAMQLPLTVYSRDGKLIAQIGEQRRIPVAREQIPQVVVDAFLASEDDRFFEHPGVDWQGLVRALATNVSAGGVREGGGTITMQLARNTVLTSERTLRRKLKEVFLALRIEREFDKAGDPDAVPEPDFPRPAGLRHRRRRGDLLQQARPGPDAAGGRDDRRAPTLPVEGQSGSEHRARA